MLPLAHTRREAFNTEVESFVQCFTNYIFEIRSLEVEFQSEINRHLCAGSIALGHRMNEPETPAANTPYNQIAGQSVERLAAISDGIFAVAMTLLVLDLHDPDSLAVPHLIRAPAENSNKSKS
jgi:Endosomal/lysosomal potassium channel TMEM175